jgi:hypothetical protein
MPFSKQLASNEPEQGRVRNCERETNVRGKGGAYEGVEVVVERRV